MKEVKSYVELHLSKLISQLSPTLPSNESQILHGYEDNQPASKLASSVKRKSDILDYQKLHLFILTPKSKFDTPWLDEHCHEFQI